MERIKSLGWYQKGVLLLIAAMVLAFTVIYPVTIARVGFAYKNTILVPSEENGSTVYSGNIHGKQARFTVLADKTVEFQCGNQVYGPYTVTEDPTAIPQNEEMAEWMTGIELRSGEKILFRGGVLNQEGFRWLYHEDGGLENVDFSVTTTTSNGIEMDENGNGIDPMEPSVVTILDLMSGPELTHKGEWIAWLSGVVVCVLTAMSILFADELFQFRLAFQIRQVDQAEPSEWEMIGRYIAWTVLPILAMIVFLMGLN